MVKRKFIEHKVVGNIQVTSRGNLCSNNWQFHVRYDHLEMDWFKDKLMLMKTMILIHIFFQVDRLEDELMREQEKLKGITEELEQTFAEMSGY